MPVTNLPMNTTNLNMATNVRWIATLPMQALDPSLNSRNTAFNLTSYSVPTLSVGTTSVSQYGYEVEIPTHVRNQDKTITFEYLLSSDWHQWKILSNWLDKIVNEDGTGTTSPNMASYILPIRVLLLSEFKHPIFEIIYHDCWIKDMGGISLDYQDDSASVIKHNFTVAYSHFELNDDF